MMWRVFLCLGAVFASASAAVAFTALRLVADLNPGRDSSGIQNFFVWKDQVWFVAAHEEQGKSVASLYCSDGTTTGPRRIKDIPCQSRGSLFDNPFVFENHLYFQGPNAGLGRGSRVWVTDGTETGTRPVSEDGKDVCDEYKPFLIGERLVLSLHGDYEGHGLVALNLHTLKTEALAVPFDGWQDYTDGAMLNGAMLKLDLEGNALWRIDGTSAGMKKLPLKGLPTFENDDGIGQFVSTPTGVLMLPNGSKQPLELWHTDGKAVVKLGAWEWPQPAMDPLWVGRLGKRVVVLASDRTRRCGLWCSDGTMAGTHALWKSDPYKEASFSMPPGRHAVPVVSGEWLFFTMDDGQHGEELWCTDGTKEGTHLVIDIALGNEDAEIFKLSPATDGRVLFKRKNANSGRDLWISDGTEGGSRRLASFESDADVAAVLGKTILLMSESAEHGRELHALDISE